MRLKVMAFVLVASLFACAHGRSSGAGRPSGVGGMPTGVGQPGDVGRPSDVGGRPSDAGKPSDAGRPSATQQPLKDAQVNSGAFRMLEQKTGMTADQLKTIYASSGAKNFGEFVSAVVVSKNLNLDTNQVLQGLKTQSLSATLKNMGVPSDQASAEIKKAKKEVADANKKS